MVWGLFAVEIYMRLHISYPLSTVSVELSFWLILEDVWTNEVDVWTLLKIYSIFDVVPALNDMYKSK